MKKVVDIKLLILLLAMTSLMVDSVMAQNIDSTKTVQSEQPKIQIERKGDPRSQISN